MDRRFLIIPYSTSFRLDEWTKPNNKLSFFWQSNILSPFGRVERLVVSRWCTFSIESDSRCLSVTESYPQLHCANVCRYVHECAVIPMLVLPIAEILMWHWSWWNNWHHFILSSRLGEITSWCPTRAICIASFRGMDRPQKWNPTLPAFAQGAWSTCTLGHPALRFGWKIAIPDANHGAGIFPYIILHRNPKNGPVM